MSDCCFSTMAVRRKDIALFEELGFLAEDGQPADTSYVHMFNEKCNYAEYNALHKLACDHVPFYGQNEPGIEYPGGLFASADGEIAWPAQINGMIAVRFDERQMAVVERDVFEVRRYAKLLDRAKTLLGV